MTLVDGDVMPPGVGSASVNHLDDRFSASAAIAGRELFLRGERYLYSLAEESEDQ